MIHCNCGACFHALQRPDHLLICPRQLLSPASMFAYGCDRRLPLGQYLPVCPASIVQCPLMLFPEFVTSSMSVACPDGDGFCRSNFDSALCLSLMLKERRPASKGHRAGSEPLDQLLGYRSQGLGDRDDDKEEAGEKSAEQPHRLPSSGLSARILSCLAESPKSSSTPASAAAACQSSLGVCCSSRRVLLARSAAPPPVSQLVRQRTPSRLRQSVRWPTWAAPPASQAIKASCSICFGHAFARRDTSVGCLGDEKASGVGDDSSDDDGYCTTPCMCLRSTCRAMRHRLDDDRWRRGRSCCVELGWELLANQSPTGITGWRQVSKPSRDPLVRLRPSRIRPSPARGLPAAAWMSKHLASCEFNQRSRDSNRSCCDVTDLGLMEAENACPLAYLGCGARYYADYCAGNDGLVTVDSAVAYCNENCGACPGEPLGSQWHFKEVQRHEKDVKALCSVTSPMPCLGLPVSPAPVAIEQLEFGVRIWLLKMERLRYTECLGLCSHAGYVIFAFTLDSPSQVARLEGHGSERLRPELRRARTDPAWPQLPQRQLGPEPLDCGVAPLREPWRVSLGPRGGGLVRYQLRPGGGLVRTAGADRQIKLWPMELGTDKDGETELPQQLAIALQRERLLCVTSTPFAASARSPIADFVTPVSSTPSPPLPDRSADGDVLHFASASEDRTCDCWSVETGACLQALTCPAVLFGPSVGLVNGDLAVAGSDAAIRVFTAEAHRLAPPDLLPSEVADSAIPVKIGDLDTRSCRPEALTSGRSARGPGYHGEERGAKIEAHQWSNEEA
uniref:TRAF-type domain-containing protein n=1 Tax=Macrostomum lignano TaxID=282301 RepID=A0A1I8FDM1_9PLAT